MIYLCVVFSFLLFVIGVLYLLYLKDRRDLYNLRKQGQRIIDGWLSLDNEMKNAGIDDNDPLRIWLQYRAKMVPMSYHPGELPQYLKDAIKNSKMDPRHDHLNQLLDD